MVNNSQKIEIANRYTFKSIDSITTGLVNPRYFVSVDGNKGYVSNWGDPNDNTDDYLAVLDLRTNTITSTIDVDFGPERMVTYNNKIFVAHQGAYGQNNLISVISGASVESIITVGDVPNSMVVSVWSRQKSSIFRRGSCRLRVGVCALLPHNRAEQGACLAKQN